MTEPLTQLKDSTQIERALPAHERNKQMLLETFLAPNGVIAGRIPEGVSQHRFLKPHFAVDRVLKFEDIKAGDEGVWFQRTDQIAEHDDGQVNGAWHAIQPLNHILGVEPRMGADGKPNGFWTITVEAPGFTDDHDDWRPGVSTAGQRELTLGQNHWRPYQRHVWLPLGWGTEDGYPKSIPDAIQRELLTEGTVLKMTAPARNGTGDVDGLWAAISSNITTVTAEYLAQRRENGATWHDGHITAAYFTLYPPINLDNFEGQGDKIPDMPNQEGGGKPQPQPGDSGEGEGGDGPGGGQPEQEEIPPMPGEAGYDATDAAKKLDHYKQQGWWGSQTG